MKQITSTLTACILLIAMISCSKEESRTTAQGDITGTYKFVSLQAKTSSTAQTMSGSDIIKTVAISDYTTQNNTGTVIIDANKMISTNLAYSINSTVFGTLYENGVVTDTFSSPFQVTLPATSGASPYKKIGADSLYFASGSSLTGAAAAATLPGGAKIKFENGKLMLYGNFAQSTTTTNQGATVTTVATAAIVTTLQKQ